MRGGANKLFVGVVLGLACSVWGADAEKLAYTVAKETTVVFTPLRKDGAPDYVGALNERFGKGVTAENNGFAAMQQLLGTENGQLPDKTHDAYLKLLGIEPTPAGTEVFVSFPMTMKDLVPEDKQGELWDVLDGLRKRMWKENDPAPYTKDAVAFLKKNEAILDRVAGAVGKPKWWSPSVSPNGTMVGVVLPSLGLIREVANTLAARAMLRAGSGDFAGFLEDIRTLKQLGARMTEGTTLIECLVGVAIDAIADDAAGAVVGSGTLRAEECQKVQEMLRAVPKLGDMVTAIDVWERWSVLDIAERISGGGLESVKTIEAYAGEDKLSPLRMIQADEADWDVVLLRLNKRFDRVIANYKLPSIKEFMEEYKVMDQEVEQWSRDFARPDPWVRLGRQENESREAYSGRVAKILIAALFPSLNRADILRRRSVMQDEMLMVLAAAAEVKAKTGKWPGKLEELVGNGVKALPVDVYKEEQAVRYVVTEAGVRVYSVGENGVDDGGVRDYSKKMDDIGVGVVHVECSRNCAEGPKC